MQLATARVPRRVPSSRWMMWVVLLLSIGATRSQTTTDAPPSTTDAPPSTTDAPPSTTDAPPSTTDAPPPTTTTEPGNSSTTSTPSPQANGTNTTSLPPPSTSTTTTTTTTTTTVAPPPAVVVPANATVAVETVEYPVIIGGGAVIFALVIGACYVTFMWQQKALRLYKANYEEIIKDRGRARREIEDVFRKGENRVFDYKADKEGGGDEEIISDLSPVAMRARILGQQYTAARYVEKKQAHPMTIAPSPKTYVGRGPVYYPPKQFSAVRYLKDDDDAVGSGLYDDDAAPAATPLVKPQLFEGLTIRPAGHARGVAQPHTTGPDDSSVSHNDAASSVASGQTNSHASQRRIVDQALQVHLSIQELCSQSTLRNMNTSSSWY